MASKVGQDADITKANPTEAPLESASVHEGKFPDTNAIDIVHAAEEEFTEEQYRKLVRKVDLILLPLMWVSSWSVMRISRQVAQKTCCSVFGLVTDKEHVIVRLRRVLNMPTKHPFLPSQPLASSRILTWWVSSIHVSAF
jgi:hypothetical protein